MDAIFVYLPSGEDVLLINLYQIVTVDGVTDDQVSLHTSDGKNHTIHGREAVDKLITILTEYTMTLDGRPLPEVLAETSRPGLKIVKKPEE